MDSQSLSWICYWAFVVYACNKMWDSISHHTSYLCSFLSQFLMYVTLLSTLKSYFSGTEAPVCAATLSWSLASWSAETREVNFYTSELRTTPNKQGRQQNSSERPLNILRLKLQSHSAFLYDKKRNLSFYPVNFVIPVNRWYYTGAGKNTNNIDFKTEGNWMCMPLRTFALLTRTFKEHWTSVWRYIN